MTITEYLNKLIMLLIGIILIISGIIFALAGVYLKNKSSKDIELLKIELLEEDGEKYTVRLTIRKGKKEFYIFPSYSSSGARFQAFGENNYQDVPMFWGKLTATEVYHSLIEFHIKKIPKYRVIESTTVPTKNKEIEPPVNPVIARAVDLQLEGKTEEANELLRTLLLEEINQLN